ncbi:MAG: TIM barrel protein [Acidobacteria bacterium]|nr:TIM barrel protein [Acidobacteriota bacterium]
MLTRREIVTRGPLAAIAGIATAATAGAQDTGRAVRRGRLKQSVCRWPYGKIPLREFCRAVADLGLTGIDLLNVDEWAAAKEFGLACSMGSGFGGTIANGLNDPANHDAVVKGLETGIPLAAKMGVPNVITFFGNRRGRSDEDAIANCVTGLNRVKRVAEDHGVTICVELLNSKVNHKDYHGDKTPFGVAVVSAVDSPRVKLLYDIYHMQIMEGDVIRTIREHHRWIAHYHTGGVPGRNEIDQSQELNYPAIARAIVDTGFSGFFAHEFVPTRDPLTSLREAVMLCDV